MDVEALKALADERRIRVVEQLAGGERCICDLAAALEISDALVSHHVKRLREAGLVRTHRVGAWVHCSLEPGSFARLAEALAVIAGRADEIATRPAFTSCPVRSPATEADAGLIARD
jgi:ArsR family transcriptional regulator